MSLLDHLFKKNPVLEMSDPVFGRITFDQSIWAFTPHPPTEGFMITIDAPETGPVQEQRKLFQHVRSHLGEFEQCAKEYMRSRVDDGVEVPALTTYSVEIGSAADTARREFVLELSDSDAIIIHRVTFCGTEPVDYGFDD
jgi:hypothetical protein